MDRAEEVDMKPAEVRSLSAAHAANDVAAANAEIESSADSSADDRSVARFVTSRTAAIWAIRFVFVLCVVAVWQGLTTFELMNPVFIGTPAGTLREFVLQFNTGIVTTDLGYTIRETLIGFLFGSLAGLIAGALLAQNELVERAAAPLLTAANSLPRVTLAPLFIIWFGLGSTAKVALVISVIFFIMAINTIAGLTMPDPDRELLARTLGASKRQRLFYFVIPGAIPTLMAGLELSLVYSFLSAVVGEFVGGSHGLGVRLQEFANSFEINKFFAVIILLAIVTTAMAQLLQVAGRRATRWYGSDRLQQ
jgi:ABC-type nitrate/sulfonate/bicarbonate transport system permease component